jgi:hypothetical protein
MARTPRMLSRRGHFEAETGENIRQGKPRDELIEKIRQTNQQEKLRGLTGSESEPPCWSA